MRTATCESVFLREQTRNGRECPLWGSVNSIHVGRVRENNWFSVPKLVFVDLVEMEVALSVNVKKKAEIVTKFFQIFDN